MDEPTPEQLDAFASALMSLSEAQKAAKKRVQVGFERFTLVKFDKKNFQLLDLFDSKIKLNIPKDYVDAFEDFEDNETILAGDNGLGVNFDRKKEDGWNMECGVGGGHPYYIIFMQFIEKCHFFDIEGRKVWGISKIKEWDNGSHSFNLEKIEKIMRKKFGKKGSLREVAEQ